MPHNVFISYATPDQSLAEAACQALEDAGIRCWIAPRDIPPGRPWPREIPAAIEASQVMVLIFTARADASDNVLNEVSIAHSFHVPVLAYRAEPLHPHGLMYYLNAVQWLTPPDQPLELCLPQLVEAVRAHLPPPVAPAASGGSGIPSSNAPKFIDRGAVMDELRQALRARAITGLSGMGGLGKTEIAIQLAHEIESAQPNSTLWISVAEKPPEDVQAEMAFKLGLQFPAGVSDGVRWDLLRAHLQAHPRAVFFDDVRKGFLGSLRRCLPPAPPCAVMITSRRGELPGIPAGAMRPLDVMNAEQASVLLRSVRGLEAALEAEPQAADRLIEACRRHPLALSLAASRLLKHLRDSNTPVATFAALLTDRLAQLRLDESADPLRSLAANFHLSYAELEPLDQLRYRCLAVFAPSGFGLEGAAAVWGENNPPEPRNALERLQDASLVLPAEAPARWRLHDLLQEFALEQLEGCGEAELSWSLLENYLIQLFQQHQSDLETAPQLPLELDNLQAAIKRLEPLRQQATNALAVERVESLAHFGSQYAEVIASRGISYANMDRHEEALADLDQAIQLDPGLAWAIAGRAALYRRLGRLEDSLAGFNQALELEPDFAVATADRGVTYHEMKRYTEALADLSRALELGYQEAWVYVVQGAVLRELERLEESLASFDRALELDPEFAFAAADRGRTYRFLARYAEALADFNRALELGYKDAWVYANRGAAQGEMGHYEESLADFDEAIRLDPNEAWAWANRGETYRSMGKLELALADINHAINNLNFSDAVAFLNRGKTLGLMGRYEDAIADLNQAVRLAPQTIASVIFRAETYFMMGRYDDALADFDLAGSHNLQDALTLTFRADTYRLKGLYEQALADANQALQINPQYSAGLQCRGLIYLRLRQFDQALADFQQALSLEVDDWGFYLQGVAQSALGDQPAAQHSYQQAVAAAQPVYEAEPDDWSNTFNLALYLLAAGDEARSEQVFRAALSDPGIQKSAVTAAARDLEEYLAVFPHSPLAEQMRGLLMRYQP